MAITHTDRAHLEYCLDLAEQALEAGDQPFGDGLPDTGCGAGDDVALVGCGGHAGLLVVSV